MYEKTPGCLKVTNAERIRDAANRRVAPRGEEEVDNPFSVKRIQKTAPEIAARVPLGVFLLLHEHEC
jgi:hypothetical protein